MFYTIIQYIFVAVVFVIAVVYVIKMAKDSFGSKKSCAKGCGCEDTFPPKESTKN
ncbi:MAG: FeoB-associated Cys-rich membrane protein [Flavobacteriaceae bacterium]|jgi:hypothetical protein|nr:FeoB-associated Cys-rich membrane protein [Flavobacteriaceae bacterium]